MSPKAQEMAAKTAGCIPTTLWPSVGLPASVWTEALYKNKKVKWKDLLPRETSYVLWIAFFFLMC